MLLVVVLAAVMTQAPSEPASTPPPPPPARVTTESPAAGPLPLQVAITRAAEASPWRAGPAALVAGATAAVATAGRPLNPLVEFRTENWTPSTATRLPLDVWALVSQPVELGGKRGLRHALAEADRGVAVAALAAVDRQLAVRTTGLYVSALRARGAVEGLQADREALDTLSLAMRRRLAEGYIAEADLLRVETEAARLDIDLTRAAIDLDRSLDELTALLGMPERLDARRLVDPGPVDPPTADEAVTASTILRHPDLRDAEARVTRARQQLSLERARRLPDPSVVAGYKRTLGVTTAVGAVTATIPLFDRNATAAAVASGELRAAEAEREATRVRLISESRTLVGAATTLADRAARARSALLVPAAGVRDAARAAFNEGSVDVLRLLDAERVYRDVQRVTRDLQLEAAGAAVAARIALGEAPLP